MSTLDSVILGINHMFLYPLSMTDTKTHTETLIQLAENPLMDALDCWVCPSNAKEELRILRNCEKQINYNIGDRYGEVPVFPATNDAKQRAYSLDILRRECEYAVECGAKKIIFGSGPDVPDDREDAQKRFVEFVLDWSKDIPKDICLALEPVDRDIDKFALFGTLEDTCRCVEQIKEGGFLNTGILLDMGHIPIMYETLESAIDKCGKLLNHIHLGNCVLKNKENPLYGDKHPCWGAADGEYNEKDGEEMLRLLKAQGYLSRGYDQTISFEMRPLIGKSAEQTVEYLAAWFKRVYNDLICS